MRKHYCAFDSMFQLSIFPKREANIQIYGARSVERTPGALIKERVARARPCCFYTDFAVTITTIR